MSLITAFAAFGLALVHVLAGRLHFQDGAPRSLWLSTAGGISVAYVFLHLLPELAKGQEVIEESAGGLLQTLDTHAYLVAFTGLAAFYGLERGAKHASRQRSRDAAKTAGGRDIFWLHIALFAVYNMLIGYLLVKKSASVPGLAVFFVAMALHFLVNDVGLRQHYPKTYASIGRWLLAASILAGWLVGATLKIPELATSVLIAFLAGGVILNVLKEELPEERQSRFSAFLLGGGSYAVLLLLVSGFE